MDPGKDLDKSKTAQTLTQQWVQQIVLLKMSKIRKNYMEKNAISLDFL